MARLLRKDFAALCGDTPKDLNVYIFREKVSPLATNAKLIDTENPKNKSWYQDRQGKNYRDKGLKSPKISDFVDNSDEKPSKNTEKAKKVSKTKESTLEVKKAAEPKEIRQKIARQEAIDQRRVDKENAKKDLDIEALELKIEREKFLFAKSAGKLLPVELVQSVIKLHGNTFLKEFEKGIEKMSDLFVNIMAGGDPSMRVRILSDGKKILERCVKDAGEKADADIDAMVESYSESLLRGQKKV